MKVIAAVSSNIGRGEIGQDKGTMSKRFGQGEKVVDLWGLGVYPAIFHSEWVTWWDWVPSRTV
jgi:hypothetical protein